MSRPVIMAALALALALPVAAEAQERTQNRDQGQQQMSPQGKGAAQRMLPGEQFALNAASTGIFEERAGELAMSKSQNEQVLLLAKQTAQDHHAANLKLVDIAAQQGMNITTVMNDQHTAQLSHLRTLNGVDFDRAYARMQVQGHQQSIRNFEREASANQGAFSQFAQNALPTLRQHLQMAQSAQAAVTQTAQVPDNQ